MVYTYRKTAHKFEHYTIRIKRQMITFLKLVSGSFYQIFIISLNDSPSKTMKNVFRLKSWFFSQAAF